MILENLFKVEQTQPQNWRSGPKYFTLVSGGLPVGVVNLSLAWFELGHEVDIRSPAMC